MILDGKASAARIKDEVKLKISKLDKKPSLAVVIVGQDPASHVYVKNKIVACEYVGITSVHIELPSEVPQEDLLLKISELNNNPDISAILVQLPLPDAIDAQVVIDSILPSKDADGLTTHCMGALVKNKAIVKSCTPSGIIEILKHNNISLKGKTATVVGRSQIVGLPMAQLLIQENVTVTQAHSYTQDLATHTRNSDIVVLAAGKPEFFGKEYFKGDAVIIDVGIHRKKNAKLCGDVKFSEVSQAVQAITPVPGGVGPMTIAMLMKNTLSLHLATI